VAENGNVTMFEWQSGKCPARVEAVEMDLGGSDDEDNAVNSVENGEVRNL